MTVNETLLRIAQQKAKLVADIAPTLSVASAAAKLISSVSPVKVDPATTQALNSIHTTGMVIDCPAAW